MRSVTAGLLAGLWALVALAAGVRPVAAQGRPPLPSVLVLDATAKNGAVNLGGGNKLTVGQGDLVVNSSHKFALFNANSTVEVAKGAIHVVGGYNNLGEATTKPTPTTGARAVADPLKDLEYPPVGECQSRQKLFVPDNREATLKPGYYLGGINVFGKGIKLTLEPGMYVVMDGDFFVGGAKVEGKGVTIVMSGQTPGKLNFANGCDVALSAPTSGPLKDILIVSAGAAQGSNSDIGFNGAKCALRGTVYAPQGRVGVFAKSAVTLGHLICHNLMMNTEAALTVTGLPAGDPGWEPAPGDG